MLVFCIKGDRNLNTKDRMCHFLTEAQVALIVAFSWIIKHSNNMVTKTIC